MAHIEGHKNIKSLDMNMHALLNILHWYGTSTKEKIGIDKQQNGEPMKI